MVLSLKLAEFQPDSYRLDKRCGHPLSPDDYSHSSI
jgi:hypothetical protein